MINLNTLFTSHTHWNDEFRSRKLKSNTIKTIIITYLKPKNPKSCDRWSSAVSDIGQAICSKESRTIMSQAVTCGVLDSHTRSDRTRRHLLLRVGVRLLNRGLKLPISRTPVAYNYLGYPEMLICSCEQWYKIVVIRLSK